MPLLSIETTCDETAAAVISQERRVLSSVVASQDELHARWRGVVPEIASRAHVDRIIPIIDQAINKAGIKHSQITNYSLKLVIHFIFSLMVSLIRREAGKKKNI